MKNKPPLRKQPMWVLSNLGNPWFAYCTKREAMVASFELTGHQWAEAKKYMEIRKVRIVESL